MLRRRKEHDAEVLDSWHEKIAKAWTEVSELAVRHVEALDELERLTTSERVAELARRVEAIERALVANFGIDPARHR
jgi:hypothetical protein